MLARLAALLVLLSAPAAATETAVAPGSRAGLAPPTASAAPVFPPGSRVGLVPPEAMQASRRFLGFENTAKQASIAFVEMPAGTYETVTADLTKESLKAQGVTLTSRETVKVGDRDALLISGDQALGAAKVRKWMLVTADAAGTALVIGEAGSRQGYSDREMRAALLSVALKGPLPIEDQMKALPFTIPERAGFRPIRVADGQSLTLTEGPSDSPKNADQPFLMLTASPGRTPAAGEARERFARAALAINQSLTDVALERSQSFRLKGVEWHEIVARATHGPSGEPVVVMQTIRFDRGLYVRMVGMAKAGARDAVLPRFRALIDNLEVEAGSEG
ncbi:MAG TPA: hypothetical protein VHL98_02230 [Microvirga sp.]|jgi:hypothetical protein|nr:hypothetical protein [Microvirga sp.]